MSDRAPGQPAGAEGVRRPAVIAFDVNETLSDLAPLASRFEDVGAPAASAQIWFAGLLRDGFALAAAGAAEPFARIAEENLRTVLQGRRLDRGTDDAVRYVMAGFAQLPVHADVAGGVRALSDLGVRLVTLSNGSTSVARGLLERSGLVDRFERLMSVEDAGIWKPAPGSYAYAVTECGVEARDAMLVAVHPWDVDGAARAGLATAWVNRSGAAYPRHFRRPDVEISSLTELAARLS